MGFTYADITLVNTVDEELAARNLMLKEEIRSTEVRAFVDSGASTLVINKELKEQLGLRVLRTGFVQLGDGSIRESEFVGPVSVRFKTRGTTCEAIVIPNAQRILLGVIPIEGMDVYIDPTKEELALPPTRPYIAQTLVM